MSNTYIYDEKHVFNKIIIYNNCQLMLFMKMIN